MTRTLKRLMDELVAPMVGARDKPIALAHSMGGHILLRYLSRHPDRFAAAAFSAPMLHILDRRPATLAGAAGHQSVMVMPGPGPRFCLGHGGARSVCA